MNNTQEINRDRGNKYHAFTREPVYNAKGKITHYEFPTDVDLQKKFRSRYGKDAPEIFTDESGKYRMIGPAPQLEIEEQFDFESYD